MDRPVPSPVAFDRYVLDPVRRILFRDGEPVAVSGKTFDLLAVLVDARGAALSRESLYGHLWPNGTVEDGNLTQNVYLLRRTLDPFGDGRAFVETRPRFGYRFAMAVVTPPAPPQEARRARRAPVLAAAAAALVALLAGGSAPQPATVALAAQATVSYSLGMYHLNMRSASHLRHSADYFARTVREDPRSAFGYAGLAAAYALQAEFEKDGSAAFARDLRLARRYRNDALARDAANAEAHAVSGFLAYRFDGDPTLAEGELRRALAIDPRNTAAHHWHAVLLFSRGALDAALAEWELAHRLDPTSEVVSRWLGRAYYYRRRPADAVRVFAETLAIEPDDRPAWLGLAAAQEQRGDLRDALRTLGSVRRRMPDQNMYVIPSEARVRLLSRRGNLDAQTVARIDRLVAAHRLDAAEAALFYIALKRNERALAVLRRAPPPSAIVAAMDHFDPRFDSVRTDPRFRRLGIR